MWLTVREYNGKKIVTNYKIVASREAVIDYLSQLDKNFNPKPKNGCIERYIKSLGPEKVEKICSDVGYLSLNGRNGNGLSGDFSIALIDISCCGETLKTYSESRKYPVNIIR